MRIVQGIDQLKTLIGKEIGVSDWLLITQDRIDAFARATDDFQWIHVDTQRAEAELPQRRTLAHGFLTLALAPRFKEEIYQIEGVRMVINYGMNRVRFTAPVPTHSRLRMRAELVSLEETRGSFRMITRLTFEVEGLEKPVCLADSITLLYVA